ERIYALGGVPPGELVDEPDVIGAATTDTLVDELETTGVEFREKEPAGGIVGVSGLLLGLGERRGYEAACLMGETSGYLVDPKSARAVLEIIEAAIPIEVDYASLSERAEEMEEVVKRIRQMEQSAPASEEDLRYIG
ncbi:MAG: PAC2 family protein, partial [Natronomonas sp.]